MLNQGTWLASYHRNPDDGGVTLRLACGHFVAAIPLNAQELDILEGMLAAHDAGIRMFTTCGQCAALPELTPDGRIH